MGKHESSNPMPGVAAVGASLLFFVSMVLLTRHLKLMAGEGEPAIPASEKVMYRMVVTIVAVLLLARLGVIRWRFGNIPLLLARGVLGAVAVILYFYSIDHSSAARASFLLFTFPAWGALCSWVFLKEPLGWRRVPGVLLTYMGAAVILLGARGAVGTTLVSDLAGIACGFVSGMAVTTIRALHRSDSTWMIMFSFAFFGALIGGALTAANGSYVAPGGGEWWVLLGIGVSSLGAHALFTTGFKYLDVTTAGALAMLQAPLTAVGAFILLNEELGSSTLAGGVLVLAGGVYLAVTTRARTMVRQA